MRINFIQVSCENENFETIQGKERMILVVRVKGPQAPSSTFRLKKGDERGRTANIPSLPQRTGAPQSRHCDFQHSFPFPHFLPKDIRVHTRVASRFVLC